MPALGKPALKRPQLAEDTCSSLSWRTAPGSPSPVHFHHPAGRLRRREIIHLRLASAAAFFW
jgi:hypothetical protein